MSAAPCIVGGIGVAARCTLVALSTCDTLVAAGFEVIGIVAAGACSIHAMEYCFGMRLGWSRQRLRLFDRFHCFFYNFFVGYFGCIGFGDDGFFHDGGLFLIVVIR